MSLTVLFGDYLLTDRFCMMDNPHALGSKTLVNKIQIAMDKTFAFASVGPTLSEEEKKILEQIIRQSFREAKSEQKMIDLVHPDWFKSYTHNLDLLVMTKQANYVASFGSDKYDDIWRVPGSPKDRYVLMQFDSTIPATFGTGARIASIACQEGLPIRKVTELTHSVDYSVSKEYDLVERKQLKAMKLS